MVGGLGWQDLSLGLELPCAVGFPASLPHVRTVGERPLSTLEIRTQGSMQVVHPTHPRVQGASFTVNMVMPLLAEGIWLCGPKPHKTLCTRDIYLGHSPIGVQTAGRSCTPPGCQFFGVPAVHQQRHMRILLVA